MRNGVETSLLILEQYPFVSSSFVFTKLKLRQTSVSANNVNKQNLKVKTSRQTKTSKKYFTYKNHLYKTDQLCKNNKHSSSVPPFKNVADNLLHVKVMPI